ncbi:MAG TPA: hypothetical protein ACFYEH_04015 [Candidatus Brocadiaceae bacterium]|nr:MAG: hypothetical protein A2Y09_01910 [Planctomycetes bacterium GWA2_39_15]
MPERLLYSISTRGKMNFNNFYNAFDTIYSLVYKNYPEDMSFTYLKYQTLRFLDALGHCEFDFEKRYVYVCPPSLVLLPSFGLPTAVLSGARNPELVTRIKKYAGENKDSIRFYEIPQKVKYFLLPPAIYLEAISKSLIETATLGTGINSQLGEPAAWRLINFSADIARIKQNIVPETRIEPNWQKRTFSRISLTFSKYYKEQDEIRLAEYTNPMNQQKLHWLWTGNKAAEIDRDWGRFLLLTVTGNNVILYDSKRFLLAVPANVPLPRIISRALTLCTGLAPSNVVLKGQPMKEFPADCRFNVYQAVVPSIAEKISEKLSQMLIKYNLEVDESGEIQ